MLRGLYLLSVASIALSAAAADFPNNEDLRKTRAIAGPQLSPDGKQGLVQITEPTSEGGASHVWLVDIKSGASRQLTWLSAGDKKGETGARWMPDGSAILFLAKRGDRTQLFRLPMNGGEAHPYDIKIALPESEPIAVDIDSFAIGPDGKTVALVIKDPQTPAEKKKADSKDDALALDHETHGKRLYLFDLVSGQPRVTALPSDVEGAQWNPAGDKLVAVTEEPNGRNDLAPAHHAWIVTAADPAHPEEVKAVQPTVRSALWSKDGTELYYLAQTEADAPPGVESLYAIELKGGKRRTLSNGITGTVTNSQPIPVKGGAVQLVAAGTKVVATRLTDGKAEPISLEQPVLRSIATNPQQTGWLWVDSGPTSPDHLRYAETMGGRAKALDLPEAAPAWASAQTSLVKWKSDSFEIEGLLSLPPQAKTGKVPLIAMIHGGPTGVWADSFSPLVDFLLGQGWAVLRPNPRGSTGYGAGFAAANHNDMGGGDFRDIMAGLDKVIADYPIDADRLALYGYSYGGEMAGFIEGKTDRFKAIVSGAPVTDQMSEYGTEDGSYYDRWFYGYPWDHHEDAWRQSPLAYVANAKTPFMLLQGEDDKTDPLGQSLELYRALRQVGVPVEMVQYPREDHGPLSGGISGNPSREPWHGFDARNRIVKFISKAFE